MQVKMFEVRDRMTFIPVIAVRAGRGQFPDVRDSERYLMAREGFGVLVEQQARHVILIKNFGALGKAYSSPAHWGQNERTMTVAHCHIAKNWDELSTGDVIDVEFVLGETEQAKTSEQLIDEPPAPEVRVIVDHGALLCAFEDEMQRVLRFSNGAIAMAMGKQVFLEDDARPPGHETGGQAYARITGDTWRREDIVIEVDCGDHFWQLMKNGYVFHACYDGAEIFEPAEKTQVQS